MRTVPSSQNRQLRHFHDEFASIRNESVAIINQIQRTMTGEAENNAIMRRDQHDTENLTARVASMDLQLEQGNHGKLVDMFIVTITNTASQTCTQGRSA
jgi:hypothetical protein